LFTAYRSKYPKLATEIDLMQRRELPAGWDAGLPVFPADRKASLDGCLWQGAQRPGAEHPVAAGGSADLGSSNKTTLTFEGLETSSPYSWRQEPAFGIREHAMAPRSMDSRVEAAAVRRHVLHLQRLCTARHSAVRTDGGCPRIFVFTHDAMGDGEDAQRTTGRLLSAPLLRGFTWSRPRYANSYVKPSARSYTSDRSVLGTCSAFHRSGHDPSKYSPAPPPSSASPRGKRPSMCGCFT